MQRFFDILFSAMTIIILSPLLIPIAIFLRLSGEGEIFYLQERVGRGGDSFKLYKFATMLKNSPNMNTGTITVKNDPRILPAGKFLRKTKINELPQLLNIFIGDMSIIGPRPLTNQTFSFYTPEVREEIKQVRPGLSGIGSIVFRDEENLLNKHVDPLEYYKSAIAPYKGSLEVWYVRNRSLSVYFKAIFTTIWVVLFPKSSMVSRVFKNLPTCPI